MRNFFVWVVLYYLRFFAKLSLFLWAPKIVGITGSVGKSSCRNAIYSVLSYKFGKKVKVIEKGNSETGIPLGILGLKIEDYSIVGWIKVLLRVPLGIFYLKGTKYLVVEMGIDDPFPPKNMEYLLTILKPDTAVFLNVHPVHTEQFSKVAKTREEILKKIAEEKGKIITKSGCKVGIYNRDNKYVKAVIENFKNNKVKLYSFGKGKDNFVSFERYDISLSGSIFEFKVKNERLKLKFTKFLLPKVYFETLSPAIIVGKIEGLNFEEIKKALERYFRIPPSRASIFQGINDTIIIDSTYNASYASTSEILKMAIQLATKSNRPLVFLFGDMRELGKLAEEEHMKILKEAFEGVDYFYLVGPLTKKYVYRKALNSGKFKEVKWFENSVKAGEFLQKNLPRRAIVLAKGSQNTIFLEEAVKRILKNPKDSKRLCRQNDYWMKVKFKSFKSS